MCVCLYCIVTARKARCNVWKDKERRKARSAPRCSRKINTNNCNNCNCTIVLASMSAVRKCACLRVCNVCLHVSPKQEMLGPVLELCKASLRMDQPGLALEQYTSALQVRGSCRVTS